MPRQPRLDAAGLLHHIMVRGIERRNIFRDARDRKDLIDRLSLLLPQTRTACYAWSFMSNHAHFLLRSGPSGIADLMRRLLAGYVVTFNRRHGRTGQLFQNRYKSIICEEEVYFRELVESECSPSISHPSSGTAGWQLHSSSPLPQAIY